MAQAERLVDKTVAQTRGAADDYFSLMQKAFSFYPVGGTELAEKMKSYQLCTFTRVNSVIFLTSLVDRIYVRAPWSRFEFFQPFLCSPLLAPFAQDHRLEVRCRRLRA
jgi:hypothetical protein